MRFPLALLLAITRADVRDRDVAGLQMKKGLADSVHFKFKLSRGDKPSLVSKHIFKCCNYC